MLEANLGDNSTSLRDFRSQITAILHIIRSGTTNFPSVALFSATLSQPVITWAMEELGGIDGNPSRGLVKVQLGDW